MAPAVDTVTGRLRGLDRGAHLAFLGVPYAAPPVGERRFQAPAPFPAWAGEREATAFGPVAPQDPLIGPGFRADGPESEDCLSLNVYTPGLDGARRPVLFWIHGGGFSHGAGSQPTYDGGPLVERGDVVVVTINYRVGALGYLYLGGHGGDAWGAAANAGQRDQVAALEWVRDNIAAFGGDPANVTIFGQSAGSVAVCTLLAMPAAKGLFAKAVTQSGTGAGIGTAERATRTTTAYLERIGIADAEREALKDVAVDVLLKAQGVRGALSPTAEGDSLPLPPMQALTAGAAAGIPLLIGTTRDEQKLYVAADRAPVDDDTLRRLVAAALPRRATERAGEVIATYRASRAERGLPAENLDVLDGVVTASRFRMPAVRFAESQRTHDDRTFLYQFDWGSPARRGALGACHGLELGFVFGTVGRGANDRMTGTGPDADALAERMMDAWIAFARTGNPSHPGIGEWAPYDAATRTTMVFDRETRAVAAPFEEERAIWASLIAGA